MAPQDGEMVDPVASLSGGEALRNAAIRAFMPFLAGCIAQCGRH
jgi:hypothetical protein